MYFRLLHFPRLRTGYLSRLHYVCLEATKGARAVVPFSYSAYSYSGLFLLCRRFFTLKKLLKNLLTVHILYSWYARRYFFHSIQVQLFACCTRCKVATLALNAGGGNRTPQPCTASSTATPSLLPHFPLR